MRKKDEAKVTAITTAVLTLCQRDGISNLTTANVAKEAGVSPRTIYLNYRDKTDMLSRIYEQAKHRLHAGLATQLAALDGEREAQIVKLMRFSVAQSRKYPLEAELVSALWANPELLDEQAVAIGRTPAQEDTQLYRELEADPAYTKLPFAVMTALLAIPMTLWHQDHQVSDQTIDAAIAAVLKALQK